MCSFTGKRYHNDSKSLKYGIVIIAWTYYYQPYLEEQCLPLLFLLPQTALKFITSIKISSLVKAFGFKNGKLYFLP